MKGRILALVAHYDSQDKVDPYFLFLVQQLQEVAGDVLVVSSSNISARELEILGSGVGLLKRNNIGYDFGSWKDGLASVGDLSGYDLVVLVNDSIYVGRHCFSKLFDLMADVQCDLWGVTESPEIHRHLQSYFLVFKPAFFRSGSFERFWTQMDYLRDKEEVILRGEVGLTRTVQTAGFRFASVFRPSCLDRVRVIWSTSKRAAGLSGSDADAARLGRRWQLIKELIVRVRDIEDLDYNPCHTLWDRLIADGIRLVKIELLRSNPLSLDLSAAKRILSRDEFPIGAIEAHLDRVYQTRIPSKD